MSLGLGLFLIGLAIFVGTFAGMLVMGMFCSNLRAERDAWRQKYLGAKSRIKILVNEIDTAIAKIVKHKDLSEELQKKYNFLHEQNKTITENYDRMEGKYKLLLDDFKKQVQK